MNLRLPHFPRIFTATIFPMVGYGALWGLLLSLIGLNVMLARTKPIVYADKIFDIFAHPSSPLIHESFAKILWSLDAQTAAKRELLVATELDSGRVNILGATTNPTDLLRFWEDAPRRRAAAVKYWKDVATHHPDYRDAYMQLASLSYTEGNLVQTRSYLEQAAALDPNGKTVNDLLGFILKRLEK